ncbi:lactonase family protein [Granulicella tundricola]|uniref:Uncharacterized protein n=1 Tax=Granulicella tundricola (strain ATCC BAA-1859 / DSM 23138 / MP5ACTX9) TaxID=1198114 RepID=E8X6Y1_GRATM|nr:hypothetical protein [Granulicella tundricola]ADW71090.1 hypothetical protein AciX9_3804 [Granulicella tundricola MP5ACTX9]
MQPTQPITRRTFLHSVAALSAVSITPALAASPILALNPTPACSTLSADRRHLYLAHAADPSASLPAGTVESYSIHPRTGALTLLNRQSLALFATTPTAITIADLNLRVQLGPHAHNLLPLNPDGSIARLTHSIKRITLVPSATAPVNPHA